MLTKDEENKKEWSRKKSRGILTPNERAFLLKKRKCSPDMVRYYRSNIVRKTQKAIEDLNLIFDTIQLWRIFVFDRTFVDELLRETVTNQYRYNYGKEIQRRIERKVKRNIDNKMVIKETKKQLNSTIDLILKDLINNQN